MYVLYADIMGFKERVMRTEHSKLKEEFEKLKTALDAWFVPTRKADPFKTSFFSDSTLLLMRVQKRALIGYLKLLQD